MALFRAVEFDLNDDTGDDHRTGKVEYYQAESQEEAAKHCLYTHQIHDGSAHLGHTGLVVYVGTKSYSVVPHKDLPQEHAGWHPDDEAHG